MAMSGDEDDELEMIVYEQRRAFTEAKTLTSDIDFAYQLQMQEAMAASLSLGASSSCYPAMVPTLEDEEDDDGVLLSLAEELLLSDVERLSQEREDLRCGETEIRRTKEDLRRRFHDQRVAQDISAMDDDYWAEHGDLYEKPYGESSSSASSSLFGSGDALWLYFKGLVSEERVRDETVPVAGAGIAICDLRNNLLFRSRKNVEAVHGGQVICREAAELEALLEGLNRALAFGFERIFYVCEDEAVYNCVTEERPPKNNHIAMLLDDILHLQTKFIFCIPSQTTSTKIDQAFKSAREAIVSQITWSAESSKGKGKRVRETCIICFEDTDVAQMFSVSGCLHRYCFSCMTRHVKAKLQDGMIAKCPHEGCKSEVAIASCAKFLPPNLVEVMNQRIKESTIPVTQRIYCPRPTCSELMSKDKVLPYTKNFFVGADRSGARKCMKCQKFFCMDCKVPWHYDMTCKQYKLRNPNHHGDEQMLESLAKRKLWRQCAKCSHMVELLEGCYHITCRCGYEFCYTCGAEWKKKKATCACPIWDEHNIIRDDPLHQILPQPPPQRQAQAHAQQQQQPQAQAQAHAQRQQQRQPQWQQQPRAQAQAHAQRQRQAEAQAQAQAQQQYQAQAQAQALAQAQAERQRHAQAQAHPQAQAQAQAERQRQRQRQARARARARARAQAQAERQRHAQAHAEAHRQWQEQW